MGLELNLAAAEKWVNSKLLLDRIRMEYSRKVSESCDCALGLIPNAAMLFMRKSLWEFYYKSYREKCEKNQWPVLAA